MALAVLWITFTIVVTRAFLVADGIWDAKGRVGVIRRARQRCRRKEEAARVENRSMLPQTGHSSRVASPRAGVAGASKFRFLHWCLFAMHAISVVGHTANVVKRKIPVSDLSCRVTTSIILAATILYDASVILFLLAKTEVTGSNSATTSTPACWERAAKCLSRFWACVYLPVLAVAVAAFSSSGANVEGDGCVAYDIEEDYIDAESQEKGAILAIAIAGALFLAQLGLLLALFVKPLLQANSRGGSQSSLDLYRRVVKRNLLCTVGMMATFACGSSFVMVTLGSESATAAQVDMILDFTPMVEQAVTLCLTEITIPLGFTSFVKACRGQASKPRKIQSPSQRETIVVKSARPGTNDFSTSLQSKVVVSNSA